MITRAGGMRNDFDHLTLVVALKERGFVTMKEVTFPREFVENETMYNLLRMAADATKEVFEMRLLSQSEG